MTCPTERRSPVGGGVVCSWFSASVQAARRQAAWRAFRTARVTRWAGSDAPTSPAIARLYLVTGRGMVKVAARQAHPMARRQLVRALRSDELPRPAPDGGAGPPTRRQALAATVAAPVFREVEVGGRAVLLTRLPSGEPVAFGAHCPHQGTPLHDASIYEGNLRCPRHNYVYDLHSGRNVLPTRDARPGALRRLAPGYLPTYRVEERDGWILVDEQPCPPPQPDQHDGSHQRAAPDRAAPPAARQAAAGPRPRRPHAPGRHERDQPAGPAATVGTLTATTGQVFELVLPTRPRPSHLWRVELDGDAVEVAGQDFRQQPDGTVLHRILLRGRQAGTATMTCAYALPWSPDPHEVRRFTVQVDDPATGVNADGGTG